MDGLNTTCSNLMRVPFRQGVLNHSATTSGQTFLQRVGNTVRLLTGNGPLRVVIADQNSSYVHEEAINVLDAWTSLPTTAVYLYLNIDIVTGLRSFGFASLPPVYSPTIPVGPTAGLHWYDTSNNTQYVFENGGFIRTLRCFLAAVNQNTFTGLGPQNTFIGPQAGYEAINAGRIIIQPNGSPLRLADTTLLSTETPLFIQGALASLTSLDNSTLTLKSASIIPAFSVIKVGAENTAALADYVDIQSSVLAFGTTYLAPNQVSTFITSGVIFNAAWDWPTTGAPLWISNGQLTETMPSISVLAARPPVARVIDSKRILFQQGLGSKGDKGDDGDNAQGTGNTNPVAITVNGSIVSAAATGVQFIGTGLIASVGPGPDDAVITIDTPPQLAVSKSGVGFTTSTSVLNFDGPGVTVSSVGDVASITIGATPISLSNAGLQVLSSVSNLNFLTKNISANAQGGISVLGAEKAFIRTITSLRTDTYLIGENVYVLGNSSVGDGAHYPYYWSATSVAVDDGTTAIKPASYSNGQAGRWLRLYEIKLNQVNAYSKQQVSTQSTLAYGSPILWDLNNAQTASITLLGNTTISITNLLPGGTYILLVRQDATGNRLLGFPNFVKFPDGVDPGTAIDSRPAATSLVTFYSDGTSLYFSSAAYL